MCEVNRFRLAAVQNKITYILFLMVKYYIRQVSLNKIFVQLQTKLFFYGNITCVQDKMMSIFF